MNRTAPTGNHVAERAVLAQASADITKRLAASTALPVFRKDLLPLITGVVVVVDLAMRWRVFLRICVERRYLRHRDSLSLRIYNRPTPGRASGQTACSPLLGDGQDHRGSLRTRRGYGDRRADPRVCRSRHTLETPTLRLSRFGLLLDLRPASRSAGGTERLVDDVAQPLEPLPLDVDHGASSAESDRQHVARMGSPRTDRPRCFAAAPAADLPRSRHHGAILQGGCGGD
jgi:hypothetical protein